MTLQRTLPSINDCTRVLPPESGQNIQVILDVFGNRQVDEAKAAHEMKAHRKKESRTDLAKKKLALNGGGDGKALVEAQAKELRDFWAEQGYTVKTKLESCCCDEQGRTVWRIKTNMRNGLPRNYRGPRT